MSKDLDEKARLLLKAQRRYIQAIRLNDYEWAAASGYQVGALYEISTRHSSPPPFLPACLANGARFIWRRNSKENTYCSRNPSDGSGKTSS